MISTNGHRAATPLELFFDLCFVVAVAQAAARLHHEFAASHLGDALLSYLMVFFAIWWAWMNFTWFASAFYSETVRYRLLTMVQIGGGLILAAGVPRAFDERDFAIVTLGYAVMRVGLVAQWLCVAKTEPAHRKTALRFASGVSACEVGWIVLLAIPSPGRGLGFVVLVGAELFVPVWAERAGVTPWQPSHIAERYGLFTIIVLGESILAASIAVQVALDAGESFADVAGIAAGGALIVFSMWWIYFDQPVQAIIGPAGRASGRTSRVAFLWGYGHYLIFASAAAVGAGIAAAVDEATHHAELSQARAGLGVSIPVALFLLSVWALHASGKPRGAMRVFATPVTVVLIVVASGLDRSVLVAGLLLTTLIAGLTAVEHPSRADAAGHERGGDRDYCEHSDLE